MEQQKPTVKQILKMMEQNLGEDPKPMRLMAELMPDWIPRQAQERKFVFDLPRVPAKYKHLIMIATALAAGCRLCTETFIKLACKDGVTKEEIAEDIAKLYKITRQEQDEFALMSHRRARAAIAGGATADEIVPVVIPQKKGDPIVFKVDERPMDTTLDKMAKMPTAFKKDGTVTAGNASGINDAAAAVVLMSAEKARDLGLKPLAKIVGYEKGGVDPADMGLGLTIKDIDLVELNEAFAMQALACMRELGIDKEKCNLVGGGVSIGHPIGCTGARITYSLAMQLRKSGKKRGLASLCIGGGQGMSIVLESM